MAIRANGNVGIGSSALTANSLLDLSGTNDGLTSILANNTLRFTDTDTTTAANQPIGKIEFYSQDSDNSNVLSHILSSAVGTWGGANISFAVSSNSNPVGEVTEIVRMSNGVVDIFGTTRTDTINATTVNSSTVIGTTINATTINFSTVNGSTVNVTTLNGTTVNTLTTNTSTLNVSVINALGGNTVFNGNLVLNSTGTTDSLSINSAGAIFEIDSIGRVIRGSNTALATVGIGGAAFTPGFQNHGNENQASGLGLFAWLGAALNSPQLLFSKSDSGTVGTHTSVGSGSVLGAIGFNGSDGTTFSTSATITSIVEGTVSTGVVPSFLRFSTRGTGGTFNEKMRLTADGDLRFNSGYGSAQNAYGVRAWVNFDSLTSANLFGNFVQNSGNATGTVSNTRIYVNTATDHGLIVGSQINVAYQTGDSNLAFGLRTVSAVIDNLTFWYANTTAGFPAGGSAGASFRSGTVFLERNTIRGSGAVSSITDIGVGTKIVNFAYSLTDANYSVVGTAGNLAVVGIVSTALGGAPDSEFIRIRTATVANTETDFSYNNIVVVR
jgi:hypothetical protein